MGIRWVAANWALEVRGKPTPTCAQDHIIKPEQSKPVAGEDPP